MRLDVVLFNFLHHGGQKRPSQNVYHQSSSHRVILRLPVSDSGSPSSCPAHLGAHGEIFSLSFQLQREQNIVATSVDVFRIFISTSPLG
jgi:hypothetical protein